MTVTADRLQSVLHPASIAIAGAAERATSAGGAVLKMVQASGFAGRVVPVNPKGGEILGLHAEKSLTEVKPACDIAIVAVRPDLILNVVREGVASGHRNFLILPGGFREAGPEGLVRDNELQQFAREHDVLILGPNCAGLINILDASRPYAGTFFKDMPFRGYDAAQPGVAFVSQSGAIAEEIIAGSHSLKIPVGCVISVGNGMHVGLTDYIASVADSPHCGVILFYAESVGDTEEFIRILRPITRRIPVVGLLGGTTRLGADAAARHTGSKSLDDEGANDLCLRSGVIRVKNLHSLLLAAKALVHHPSGIGKRVLVLSNSGGPGVLTADQCGREGLEMPPLGTALAAALKAQLPAEAAIANPMDLLADAREDRFGPTLQTVLRQGADDYDAILMIHVVPFMVEARPVIDALAAAACDTSIPILHSMMGTLHERDVLFETMERAGVPMFNDAEAMAIAAGVLAQRRAAL